MNCSIIFASLAHHGGLQQEIQQVTPTNAFCSVNQKWWSTKNHSSSYCTRSSISSFVWDTRKQQFCLFVWFLRSSADGQPKAANTVAVKLGPPIISCSSATRQLKCDVWKGNKDFFQSWMDHFLFVMFWHSFLLPDWLSNLKTSGLSVGLVGFAEAILEGAPSWWWCCIASARWFALTD